MYKIRLSLKFVLSAMCLVTVAAANAADKPRAPAKNTPAPNPSATAKSISPAKPIATDKPIALEKSISPAKPIPAPKNSAESRYEAADKKLNQIYREILTKYKNDKVFLASLIKAEKAWLAFREAELEARYPADDGNKYGRESVACKLQEKEALTLDRVKQIEPWLTGIEEGNVCLGSYKPKH